jgi:hypothetical protein
LDVEGVAQGLVEPDPGVEVEMTNGLWLQERGRNGDQVVTADDALIGQALGRPDFNLGTDTTDGSCDRGAGESSEDGDSRVSGQDADRPPPGGRPQVGPYDVAALYHSGTVSDASRDAAETIAGSWGSLR